MKALSWFDDRTLQVDWPSLETDMTSGQTHKGHKAKWTPKEDQALLEALHLEYGHLPPSTNVSWIRIQKRIQWRSCVQIRERYMHILDPRIQGNKLTDEELISLLRYRKIHGNKWATIAKYFDGRTSLMLKNSYYSVLRSFKREHKREPEQDELIQFLERTGRNLRRSNNGKRATVTRQKYPIPEDIPLKRQCVMKTEKFRENTHETATPCAPDAADGSFTDAISAELDDPTEDSLRAVDTLSRFGGSTSSAPRTNTIVARLAHGDWADCEDRDYAYLGTIKYSFDSNKGKDEELQECFDSNKGKDDELQELPTLEGSRVSFSTQGSTGLFPTAELFWPA